MENNPYAAPRSNVADVAPQARKRPMLVWIITILIGLGVVGGVASTLALLAGSPFGGPAVAAQLSYLGPLDHVFTLVISIASGVGYFDLFRLKRRALPIIAGTFALNALVVLANLAFRPAYRAILDQGGLITLVLGWIVTLAIIGYVWRLRSKGVLT